MKRNAKKLIVITTILLVAAPLFAQEKKWEPKDTEVWQPVPEVVTTGPNNTPPSDAIVLFDGKDFSEWVDKDGNTPKWELKDGAMTVVKGTGAISTKREFRSVQLHIEWRTPAEVKGEGQGRGNSGIFFQGRYELQVLDSYQNKTYPNGQAGSIYKQYIPLVNATKAPGEWQTYDVIFNAPTFNPNGEVEIPARITVLHNGVLIQNNVVIKGPTEYIGPPSYKPHFAGPIQLQDHGDPVSFRNIWVRPLD